MTREEQIELLTKQLLTLINTPTTNDTEPEDVAVEIKSVERTVNDLKTLNVDTNVVRLIMNRVDEIYGRKHSNIYATPLYEEFSRIIKTLE